MLIFPFSDDESSLFEGLKPIEQLLGTAGNYVVILTRYYEHTSTKQETFQTISSLRALLWLPPTSVVCKHTCSTVFKYLLALTSTKWTLEFISKADKLSETKTWQANEPKIIILIQLPSKIFVSFFFLSNCHTSVICNCCIINQKGKIQHIWFIVFQYLLTTRKLTGTCEKWGRVADFLIAWSLITEEEMVLFRNVSFYLENCFSLFSQVAAGWSCSITIMDDNAINRINVSFSTLNIIATASTLNLQLTIFLL